MHVVESVSPRCLCVSVSVSMVLFMSNGGLCGRCKKIKVLRLLEGKFKKNVTVQFFFPMLLIWNIFI